MGHRSSLCGGNNRLQSLPFRKDSIYHHLLLLPLTQVMRGLGYLGSLLTQTNKKQTKQNRRHTTLLLNIILTGCEAQRCCSHFNIILRMQPTHSGKGRGQGMILSLLIILCLIFMSTPKTARPLDL